jgi:hypothetical protein
MLVVAAWVARRLAWWLRRLAPAWLSLLPPGGRSQPFRRSRWRLLRHRHSPLSVVASDVVETAKFALGLQDGHGFRYANSAFRQAKLHSTKKPPAGLTGASIAGGSYSPRAQTASLPAQCRQAATHKATSSGTSAPR